MKRSKRGKGLKSLKKCIICAKEFPQNQRKTRNSNNFGEFNVWPILNDCLGIKDDNSNESEGLDEVMKNVSQWEVDVCPTHMEIVSEAVKIHDQIKSLMGQLNQIKENIKDEFVKSLTNAKIDASGSTEYQKIRQFARERLFKTTSNLLLQPEEEEMHTFKEENDESFQDETYPLEHVEVCPQDSAEETDALEENDVDPLQLTLDEVEFDFCELGPSSVNNSDNDIDDRNMDPDWESNDEVPPEENVSIKPKRAKSKSATTRKNFQEAAKTSKPKPRRKNPRNKNKSETMTDSSPKPKQKAQRSPLVRYKCRVCNSRFPTIEDRNQHQVSVHGPGKHFRCSICGNEYACKVELQGHEKRKHGTERPYPCNECNKTFALKSDLKRHFHRRHSPSGVDYIPCPICGKKYKGKFNLKAHVEVIHKQGGCPKKTLVCETCGKAYSNLEEFRKHRAKFHLFTYVQVTCDVCGKKLSDPRSLKKHKLSQHQKKFQYTCEICGTGCLFKSHLEAHMSKSHSGDSTTTTTVRKRTSKNTNTTTADPIVPQSVAVSNNVPEVPKERIGTTIQEEIPFQLPQPNFSGYIPYDAMQNQGTLSNFFCM